ncbi:MAG: FCD domain-containing protein, partial [Pseudomonadota bacterium]|nr:FCD domain-containing protein [Pseudomonadota bacterium]
DDRWEANIIATAHTLAKVESVSSSDELLDLWDKRHKAYHSAIVAGCNSPHLMQVREALFDQVERYRHLWLRETVFSSQALAAKRDEHAALTEAVLSRHTQKARQMMRDHLMTPVPIITDVMAKRGLS